MDNSNNLMVKGWTQVPNKLLLLLLQRIAGLSTYVRFSAVCRNWHLLASTNKCEYKHVPWLMLAESVESIDSNVRKFYDLSTNEIYQLPLPQAQGRKIIGCNFGWLMTIGKDGMFHLLNPITGVQLPLPPMSTFESLNDCSYTHKKYTPQKVRNCFAVKATLSSDPSSSSDVVAMVVNLGYDTTCLSFCRTSDKKWRKFPEISERELDYAKDKFYTITWSGSIYACDIENYTQPRMEEVAKLPNYDYPLSCYTVECGGELLFIVITRRQITKRMYPNQPLYLYESSFKVYKLDQSGSKSLVEVNSIGDYAVFLGNNNAICLPATSDIKAYKRNSIYFTPDGDDQYIIGWGAGRGCALSVFSLDDGRIRQLNYLKASKAKYSLHGWIIPNHN